MQEIKQAIHELYDLSKAKFNKEKQIQNMLQEYVNKHRVFQEGEKVKVYTSKGIFFSKAVIGKAKTSVYLDEMSIKHSLQEEDLMQNLTEIVYEVFGLKKDNTRSEKHLFSAPHYLPSVKSKYHDYYIVKP